MLRVVSIAAVICLPATPTLARQVAAPTTESNATFFATQQVIPQDNPNPESSKFSPIVVEKDWAWGSNALSGDWCGARTRLSNAGVVLSATSTTDLATVIGGGNQQGFIMPYLIDVNLSLDTEKFGAWQGGEFFADFQQAGATQLGSRYVPDYWGWDVIYPYKQNYTELSQYWYQQSLFDGALRLKFGKIDANTDFAESYKDQLFINTAAYLPGGLVLDIPTYPNQAGGAEILIKPMEWFEAKFGFFDGSTNAYSVSSKSVGSSTGNKGIGNFLWDNPSSYFLISEFGPRWKASQLEGLFNIGLWKQTGNSAVVSNALQPLPTNQQYVQGPWGSYATLSQELFKPEGASEGQKLVGFGQFGWSSPTQNASLWSLQGGANWQGILPNRPRDTAGLLVAYNYFSNSPTLTPSPGQGEIIVETFYNIQVTPWLGIQPDVQYINQPSSVSGASVTDAWILTLRISMNF